MYKFRFDPNLGIAKAAYRRIPSVYRTCLEILKAPWDNDLKYKNQPRYGVNERRVYWRVVEFVKTNVTSEHKEKVSKTILHGIEEKIN